MRSCGRGELESWNRVIEAHRFRYWEMTMLIPDYAITQCLSSHMAHPATITPATKREKQ
jgi:hypothetical protein